jgi:GcrA cell cycle regulator
MSRYHADWTDDRVDLLKALWKKGSSASQIAKILGLCTRNAVIGKAHRLGLSGTEESRRAAANEAHRKRQAALCAEMRPQIGRSPRPMGLETGKDKTKPIAPTPLPVEPPFVSPRVPLADLTPSMCKWPIGTPGDPDFAYCGFKAHPGVPYCVHHAQRAYVHSPHPTKHLIGRYAV